MTPTITAVISICIYLFLFSDKNECASNNGGCAHHCLNTYLGRQCYCKHGYILQNDGVACEGNDIRCRELSVAELAMATGHALLIN
jgi:hypothetical protein